MNPPEFSTDPLIYFLLHSSLFVLGLGTLFFTLGILLGRLIWSPYKRQTLQLLAEQEIHKGEIAKLKRHLAEAKLNGAPLTATDLRQNVGPIPSPLPNPKPTQATTSPPEFSSQEHRRVRSHSSTSGRTLAYQGGYTPHYTE